MRALIPILVIALAAIFAVILVKTAEFFESSSGKKHHETNHNGWGDMDDGVQR